MDECISGSNSPPAPFPQSPHVVGYRGAEPRHTTPPRVWQLCSFQGIKTGIGQGGRKGITREFSKSHPSYPILGIGMGIGIGALNRATQRNAVIPEPVYVCVCLSFSLSRPFDVLSLSLSLQGPSVQASFCRSMNPSVVPCLRYGAVLWVMRTAAALLPC